jgi:hypothetical protein
MNKDELREMLTWIASRECLMTLGQILLGFATLYVGAWMFAIVCALVPPALLLTAVGVLLCFYIWGIGYNRGRLHERSEWKSKALLELEHDKSYRIIEVEREELGKWAK